MSQTLVIGSIALDTIDTAKSRVDDALGGSASYGAVAASFFSPTHLVGIVGTDFPTKHRKMFRERGIDISGLESKEGATFRWHGYYERNMNFRHTTTTALNVFEHFQPVLSAAHKKLPFVFLANIQPELQLRVLDQIEKTKLVVMDTMDFWIEGQKRELTKVIKRSDILMISEQEARQYAETTNTIQAGLMLKALGPRAVVLKKGEHGALVFLKDRIAAVPAYPTTKVKDPTGAGDVFAGALTSYLARVDKVTDDNIIRATQLGCVMASFAVEDFTVRRLLTLTQPEITKRCAELGAMSKLPSLTPASLKPAPKKSRR